MSGEKQNSKPIARGYFRDRAVVVTGASSGIGYDAALAFGRQGAQVALLARRKNALEELAERITEAGGRPLALQCDVTRRGEVRAAIEQATNNFGQVDILVNSAGLLIPDTLEDMRSDDLERMMAVNLYGALHATQAVLPAMKAARSGSIINIGSLSGRRGITPLAGYSASKFALVGLTESLRVELFGTGVRVSLVMPAVVDTPMTREARSSKMLRAVPSMVALPVRFVTWAVMAAAAFGLAEVDVPPGSGVVEKVASLFPGATDVFLGVGTRIVQRLSERIERREATAAAEQAPRVVRSARKSEPSPQSAAS
jgi:uncharacterized protein